MATIIMNTFFPTPVEWQALRSGTYVRFVDTNEEWIESLNKIFLVSFGRLVDLTDGTFFAKETEGHLLVELLPAGTEFSVKV